MAVSGRSAKVATCSGLVAGNPGEISVGVTSQATTGAHATITVIPAPGAGALLTVLAVIAARRRVRMS